MKKLISIAFVSIFAIGIVGCGKKPMTEADMAKSYGLSMEEFQEQKEAAARMNMSIEDHMKHGGTMHMMEDGTMMEGASHH